MQGGLWANVHVVMLHVDLIVAAIALQRFHSHVPGPRVARVSLAVDCARAKPFQAIVPFSLGRSSHWLRDQPIRYRYFAHPLPPSSTPLTLCCNGERRQLAQRFCIDETVTPTVAVQRR